MGEIVSGNVYDKYGSRNPVVRWMVGGFFRCLGDLVGGLPVRRIVEVGCGEGEVAERLKRIFPGADYWGMDVSREIIDEARRRYPQYRFDVGSVYDLDAAAGKSDLLVAAEVLEHLDDPGRAMEAILRTGSRYLLVSVPREPLWRVLNCLRVKYVSSWGNTPGHINHWSRRSFVRFLKGFRPDLRVVQVRSPFPWTMALCERVERST